MSQKEVNLNRLIDSGLIKEFVSKYNGIWNHETWLNFCNILADYGFTPVDFDEVGLLLEEEKKIQTSECKYIVISICCPYCHNEIIKPFHYFEQKNVICNQCFANIYSRGLMNKLEEIKKRLK